MGRNDLEEIPLATDVVQCLTSGRADSGQIKLP